MWCGVFHCHWPEQGWGNSPQYSRDAQGYTWLCWLHVVMDGVLVNTKHELDLRVWLGTGDVAIENVYLHWLAPLQHGHRLPVAYQIGGVSWAEQTGQKMNWNASKWTDINNLWHCLEGHGDNGLYLRSSNDNAWFNSDTRWVIKID